MSQRKVKFSSNPFDVLEFLRRVDAYQASPTPPGDNPAAPQLEKERNDAFDAIWDYLATFKIDRDPDMQLPTKEKLGISDDHWTLFLQIMNWLHEENWHDYDAVLNIRADGSISHGEHLLDQFAIGELAEAVGFETASARRIGQRVRKIASQQQSNPFGLIFDRDEVTRHGHTIKLRDKCLAVLRHVIDHPECDWEDLKECWDAFVADHTIRETISKANKKLKGLGLKIEPSKKSDCRLVEIPTE